MAELQGRVGLNVDKQGSISPNVNVIGRIGEFIDLIGNIGRALIRLVISSTKILASNNVIKASNNG